MSLEEPPHTSSASSIIIMLFARDKGRAETASSSSDFFSSPSLLSDSLKHKTSPLLLLSFFYLFTRGMNAWACLAKKREAGGEEGREKGKGKEEKLSNALRGVLCCYQRLMTIFLLLLFFFRA